MNLEREAYPGFDRRVVRTQSRGIRTVFELDDSNTVGTFGIGHRSTRNVGRGGFSL